LSQVVGGAGGVLGCGVIGGTSGGDGGGAGGDGIGGPMVKVAEPTLPLGMLKISSVHPGADHSAPFQPSPYESIISSVHSPFGIACVSE
jgi:hypothetical protein